LARRRNSRPKRALLRDVFCLVSRIPSVESARCAEEAMLRRAGREATAQAARKGPRAESTRSTGEPPDRSLILNQRFKIAPTINPLDIKWVYGLYYAAEDDKGYEETFRRSAGSL
jgi:hypothetical protein